LLGTFAEWTEGVTLIPGERGAFEVTVNGETIYSKWQTKRFPELQELKDAVKPFLE
jgi:selT/selW/selH-like putative selenoprotein